MCLLIFLLFLTPNSSLSLLSSYSSIFLFFLSPVPTAPQGFSLTQVPNEPTQLSVSWTRPDPANGIVTGYTLYCSVSSMQVYPEQEVPNSFSMGYDGDTLSPTVTGLLRFTSYDCNVTANTSIGEGPPSDVETERTDEDGKCVCSS